MQDTVLAKLITKSTNIFLAKFEALPRIELGFPDSKSEVLTTILQGPAFFELVIHEGTIQMTE